MACSSSYQSVSRIRWMMDCRQPICMNFRASRTSLFQKPVATKFKSDKGRQLLSRNISAHFPHDILTLFRIFFFPLSNPLNVHRLKRPPPITSIISATITKKENKTSKRIELQRKRYAWAATACLLRNAMRIRWDGHLKARWKKKIIIKK